MERTVHRSLHNTEGIQVSQHPQKYIHNVYTCRKVSINSRLAEEKFHISSESVDMYPYTHPLKKKILYFNMKDRQCK